MVLARNTQEFLDRVGLAVAKIDRLFARVCSGSAAHASDEMIFCAGCARLIARRSDGRRYHCVDVGWWPNPPYRAIRWLTRRRPLVPRPRHR